MHSSILFLDSSYGSRKRLYSDESTSTSAIRAIIDPSRITDSPVCEIMEIILKEPLFLGSFHDTTFEVGADTLRKKREDMDDHIILCREALYRSTESFLREDDQGQRE